MSTILCTSLDEIRSFNPCASGWEAILLGQGKTESDSVRFPLIDCVKSNSISDVCWLIGKRKVEIQIAVEFAQKCAKSVAHLKNTAAANAAAAAADAAYAAAHAANAAAYDVAAAAAAHAAYEKQQAKNKQFLIDSILEYQSSL